MVMYIDVGNHSSTQSLAAFTDQNDSHKRLSILLIDQHTISLNVKWW